MIAALFALAAAMMIGGAAAVVQGFPYVRMESGLALVIAGSVAASGGAVLVGLAVVALGLRRIERAGALDRHPAPEPIPDARPRLPPLPPAGPAFVPPPEPTPEPSADLSPAHPSPAHPLPAPERPRIPPTAAFIAPPIAEPVAAEPELPMPGLAPPEAPPAPPPDASIEPAEPEPARAAAPEDDLFAAAEAQHGDASAERPPLRPSLDAAQIPEPGPAGTGRTVVGRYSSGANTYVMFEDGSIEADTPRGTFTFASLDELKGFVETGEPGARGAA